MDNREEIRSHIGGFHELSSITEQIISWDFQELSGIGFCRKHDKYAHIEIAITRLTDGFYKSCLEWAVPPELFPEFEKKFGYEQLKEYASFISNHVSALKGETIFLNFKITNAGYHPTDSWGRVCGRALFNAFASCFLSHLFENNKKRSKEYFENIEEIKKRVMRENNL